MTSLLRNITLCLFVALLTSCDKNNNLSLFTINDDLSLGAQVSQQIADDPNTYPVLDEDLNIEAYDYLNAITDEILQSGAVQYRNEFVWQMHIIDDDATLNAFATPGGYIYVYTGLIKYLENVDDLAGVLGHEIAHSDLRHSSRSLQREYGISILFSLLLGDNPSELVQITAQIAGGLAGLSFSREFESEADERSVEFLSPTQYACDGAASFFEKLEEQGLGSNQPKFLSTHPPSDERVVEINAKASALGCETANSDDNTDGMTYTEFQNLF
ncbi:MAG: M48 family metalloprotease [Reichenbachiella sp.]